MIEGLIKSKTRIKLLLKFFINPANQSYLRELAHEFDESTNSVRLELNYLTEAKILEKEKDRNKVAYKANKTHPLFKEIRSIILKTVGIDDIINTLIGRIGSPELIMLTGDYVKGKDTGIIDIVIVGEVDKSNLDKYIKQAEGLISRKVRYLLLTQEEYVNLEEKLKTDGLLLLWGAN